MRRQDLFGRGKLPGGKDIGGLASLPLQGQVALDKLFPQLSHARHRPHFASRP
jgi:hypothetical protein